MEGQLDFFYASELIVDNFAGGGGASLGLEWAFGRSPDIAINHDPEAVAMHTANHPDTTHYCEDVWKVDPVEVCAGRPVGLAWFSPDCKHFSKAKGKRPVSKKIRGLAWVVIRWAKRVRPRVIMLENVEEFQDWGPVLPDGKPCPARKGKTFEHFVGQLRRLGYSVEWNELRACDFGAPTSRKRLFLIARCDGRAIVWPKPTHGDPNSLTVKRGKMQPWRTAAECINWTLPTPSIFLTAEEGRAVGVRRPLAENTMRRIARGVQRYVLEAAEPFIVTCNHGGDGFRGHGMNEPFRTLTAARDAHGLVTAFLAKHYGDRGQRPGSEMREPFSTVTATDHHSLVACHLQRDFGRSIGQAADTPTATITAGGSGKTALVSSHLMKLRGTCKDGQHLNAPAPTITAGGWHLAEVRAFLVKYYGTDQDPRLTEPMHTVTTKPRFGLVTVQGEDYVIADIGMRMLTPRELYRAQGFPDSYIIDSEVNGKWLSKTAQVRMCGNSVVPYLARALVEANVGVERYGIAA